MSVNIKDLKKGDIVYENAYNRTYEVRVEEDPVGRENGEFFQWSFQGRNCNGVMEFMETVGLEHYGPKLSREPEYMGDLYKINGEITKTFNY